LFIQFLRRKERKVRKGKREGRVERKKARREEKKRTSSSRIAALQRRRRWRPTPKTVRKPSLPMEGDLVPRPPSVSLFVEMDSPGEIFPKPSSTPELSP
jgi:hypothetical protein